MRESPDRRGHPGAGPDVDTVGGSGKALAFADPDDVVGAGCGQVVGAPGQCGRDPQQLAHGIGDDLHVHGVSAVLVREVGPAVADPVALGERAVEQDVLGIGLSQDSQQAGCPPGEVVDVGVGGADGYAEPGGDLRKRRSPGRSSAAG